MERSCGPTLVMDCKQDAEYTMRFTGVDYTKAGIMVVTDAALGNVTEQGDNTATPVETSR